MVLEELEAIAFHLLRTRGNRQGMPTRDLRSNSDRLYNVELGRAANLVQETTRPEEIQEIAKAFVLRNRY